MSGCKAERLAIAGAVAPVLRSQSEAAAKRLVKVYNQVADPEAKTVVRVVTLADVQEGVLRRAGIELDVQAGFVPADFVCKRCGDTNRTPPGLKKAPEMCKQCADDVRPLEFTCKVCKLVFPAPVQLKGLLPACCEGCRQTHCAGFDGHECEEKPPSRKVFQAWAIQVRKGRPWQCRWCRDGKLRPPPTPPRPAVVRCKKCDDQFAPPPKGKVHKFCGACRLCRDCKKPLAKSSICASFRCWACGNAFRKLNEGPEWREKLSIAARKVIAAGLEKDPAFLLKRGKRISDGHKRRAAGKVV